MASFKQGPRPEENFTMISNDFARNPEIPIESKGIYLYMRSHRDGWNMTVVRIAKALGVSKDRVSKYINILIDHGYIVRDQTVDDHGRFGEIEYLILSEPYPEKPCPENPDTVKPDTENSPTKEDYSLSKTIEKKNIKDIAESSDSSRDLPSGRITYPDDFLAIWDAYPKRTGSKKRAYAQYLKAIKRADYQTLIQGVHELAQWVERNRKNPKYVPDAERWFRDDRWDDELVDENTTYTTPAPTSDNSVESWLGDLLNPTPTVGCHQLNDPNTIDHI